MNLADRLSQKETVFLWGTVALVVFAFFYQLGIYPLFLEEPRRALIALEMVIQDNFWVPTQTGDLYYRKPPFYNWMLILSYKLFGGYTEIATRFVSVFSHILLAFISYRFFKRFVDSTVALFASLSFLLSVDILFYFSALGEIDLFYMLLTTLSFYAIYAFGEKKAYFKLFVWVYVITAVCFLTKGLSALPYTALSLLTYFVIKRRFKVLFSVQHLAGMSVLVLLVGGYFYAYSLHAPVEGWWQTLLEESTDKATSGGVSKFLNHLVSFPLDTLKNVIPAAFFIPAFFMVSRGVWLRSNRFVHYAFWIVLVNFLLYWFSIEAKSRYVYPLFPLICLIMIYAASKVSRKGLLKYQKVVAIVLLAILTLAFPSTLFVDDLKSIAGLPVLVAVGMLLICVLWFALLNKGVRPLLVIFGVLTVGRLAFSTIGPQDRMQHSNAAVDKSIGLELAAIAGESPVYRYQGLRLSLTVVFYFERAHMSILYSKPEFEKGYFLCAVEDLPVNTLYDLEQVFQYRDQRIALIKIH
ncbi:4-amino-4-deoxy-L-arabinose transferase-like glycosyltransferase [Roseivirga pacifica]|uniref:4-amino-4-deoxy-L-arabinose transferase n=1 Tax=Roseivirga pacifica TaxID=1267423 RepID=A0A1I0QUM7_9BACT|nr:glycosyltransferase family 39 protein [Roseivirga pacifica]RKQ42547.1 4-amino-4-deoxy-L-arabinose transferase-like glycosyltransferase [Roseivirga pacifica]SEW31107.1 4-amino-4-deoxy-L-arabinose transferase [Roseivirga pacifica]